MGYIYIYIGEHLRPNLEQNLL